MLLPHTALFCLLLLMVGVTQKSARRADGAGMLRCWRRRRIEAQTGTAKERERETFYDDCVHALEQQLP